MKQVWLNSQKLLKQLTDLTDPISHLSLLSCIILSFLFQGLSSKGVKCTTSSFRREIQAFRVRNSHVASAGHHVSFLQRGFARGHYRPQRLVTWHSYRPASSCLTFLIIRLQSGLLTTTKRVSMEWVPRPTVSSCLSFRPSACPCRIQVTWNMYFDSSASEISPSIYGEALRITRCFGCVKNAAPLVSNFRSTTALGIFLHHLSACRRGETTQIRMYYLAWHSIKFSSRHDGNSSNRLTDLSKYPAWYPRYALDFKDRRGYSGKSHRDTNGSRDALAVRSGSKLSRA